MGGGCRQGAALGGMDRPSQVVVEEWHANGGRDGCRSTAAIARIPPSMAHGWVAWPAPGCTPGSWWDLDWIRAHEVLRSLGSDMQARPQLLTEMR